MSQLVVQGAQAPTPEAWASLYCELVRHVLRLASSGHRVIGILRLFGFNVFRNTYKPLLAESILEFWNRYYYYFKELLVAFFFIPTFTRLGGKLRRWPQLRLFAAVFAAAFIGNMYYHLLNLESLLVTGRVLDAIYGLRSRFFYCLLLAIGLYVSMARQQQRGGAAQSSNPAARFRRIFGVWTFFGLIYIWNVKCSAPFLTRVEFFLGLFGVM
jgi:D-alanyl-lipoteichoic acid acyltransferase DltB (MBOAT superfamily)